MFSSVNFRPQARQASELPSPGDSQYEQVKMKTLSTLLISRQREQNRRALGSGSSQVGHPTSFGVTAVSQRAQMVVMPLPQSLHVRGVVQSVKVWGKPKSRRFNRARLGPTGRVAGVGTRFEIKVKPANHRI
jgi:hypothetical protein